MSSVDLPTLGRPTSVTKPDFTTRSSSRRRGSQSSDLDRARARCGGPATRSACSAVAVDLDRLALGGTWPSRSNSSPPTVSQSPSGRSRVEQLVDLVDRHAARCTRTSPPGSGSTIGVLDVVLVDDLADELLDEVLERDQPGGAAVLVDDDRHVELLGLHLAQQLGHPLRLGHEVGRPHELARPARRLARRARPA